MSEGFKSLNTPLSRQLRQVSVTQAEEAEVLLYPPPYIYKKEQRFIITQIKQVLMQYLERLGMERLGIPAGRAGLSRCGGGGSLGLPA